MLRSTKELQGYSIQTVNDEIGQVKDFYFDDHTWVMRYLIADTGKWLPGRQVLISTQALDQPNWRDQNFPVHLTKTQVENSPSIEEDMPVSRQEEEALHSYYGWPVYWGGGLYTDAQIVPRDHQEEPDREPVEGDVHLRSVQEIIGYDIEAKDDGIGHVEDFVLDDELWTLRYLVVDTRNWLPGGKKVLVSPDWIEGVNWSKAQVKVDLTCEQIKNGPEFDPFAPVNREYEERLYDFYGRPKYWIGESNVSGVMI